MSFKSFFALNWLNPNKEEKVASKRMQRPRDVKRKKKNGKQSRLTPWRKSAPSDLFVSRPEDEDWQTPKRLQRSTADSNFNERPVDCHGLTILRYQSSEDSGITKEIGRVKPRRPLTGNFDWIHLTKSKSYFDLADATIDLDEEIIKRSGNDFKSSNSMPKLVPFVNHLSKTDSGYDTNSYSSPESKKSGRELKCYSVYGTDEFKTFNSYFNKADRIRSSSCSKASTSLDDKKIGEKIREQEIYFKNLKDELPLPPSVEKITDENVYELEDIPTNYVSKKDTVVKADSVGNVPKHKVVIAIDIGTTHSGYAFSFTNGQDAIYLMRKTEGGDPGVMNQKCPTSLLLTADGKFHSFGYSARDYYHNLEPNLAKQYLYFEKFKMLFQKSDLTKGTKISAANGITWPVLDVVAHCLNYFKRLALSEISDFLGLRIGESDVLWILTVPAIWKPATKQLMRLAAEKAGLCGKVVIALEPEAASLFCRELKLNEIVACLSPPKPFLSMPSSFRKTFCKQQIEGKNQIAVEFGQGTVYMVVDCGGGTVDITVHQVSDDGVSLKELYKASGGPHGSCEIDSCFEALLCDIFTTDFVTKCKLKYPAAFVDLSLAFESRKRAAHPYKQNSLNVPLQFSFIEYHKKYRGFTVEKAIKRYKSSEVGWSSQGMLILSSKAMDVLFSPTLSAVILCISEALTAVTEQVTHMFLVGGFAESSILQHSIRNKFGQKLKIVIPNEVSAAVLKGAVLYGLHPDRIVVRRSRFTYGIGVLHPFDHVDHPLSKLVVQNGRKFCKDIFEKFVTVDQSVAIGEEMFFSYVPAVPDKKELAIQMYSTLMENPKFVTDVGVQKCASLKLKLPDTGNRSASQQNEIRTCLKFGDTEIHFSAVDVATGINVVCDVDFLCQ